MQIHRSARRHGIEDPDILWALAHLLVAEDVAAADSPRRWLLLGTDRAGRMLELIVLVFDEGTEIVIHAMPMRSKFGRLLPMEES